MGQTAEAKGAAGLARRPLQTAKAQAMGKLNKAAFSMDATVVPYGGIHTLE